MIAYVIKNKKGKYFGYYDSENNRFEFSNKPKRFIMFNTLRDAKKIKNLWKMNKCDIVEITIAESDLEKELNKYKSLYIENENVVDYQHDKLLKKDKEIDTLNRALLRISNEKANIIQREQIDYLSFAKEIRKQVCDKIRNAFKKQFRDGMCGGRFEQVVPIDCFNSVLDQIEKGESDDSVCDKK